MNDDRTLLPEQIRNLPCKPYDGTDAYKHYCHGHRDARHAAAELAAAALSAAPAQEPVAWAVFADSGNVRLWAKDSKQVREFAASIGKRLVPLYASPLPQDPQEGKALTDERINDLAAEYGDELDQAFIFNRLGRFSAVAFARAIERELRGAQEGKAGEDHHD